MTTTQESLDRLCFLRDVTFPFVETHLEQVNLNGFEGIIDKGEGPCGTYRCLCGWNFNLRTGRQVYRSDGLFDKTEITADWWGITAPQWDSLFERGKKSEIPKRKVLVCKLIAEREQQLNIPVLPTGASICKAIMNGPKLLEDMRV